MDDSNKPQALEGIAVVGIAGRFPGSRNCDEFWQNLRDGRETLSAFSDQELIDAGFIREADRGKRVRSRGVVDDACLFDAAFFGYTPRESEVMDPQQRVFLELAWEALENAGFDPDRAPGPVGVFAGASINSYYPNNIVSRPDILGPFGVFPAIALNEKDFLATRVAYKLNLRGPAISVQTACSTSLVAVCNACQSLLSFECDVALAGGVAINFPQSHSFIHEEGGMISADGHCRPFDRDASGTLFSDGAGVVALRRLEDAVEAGDTILAVIKGFAINNDGSDKAGFTAPSVSGQADVTAMAQAFADIDPETITYVEAHGTATPLGDPIEVAGLTQAFRAGTEASQFCAIGSVKSNIGHLDVAAGIAGLIKTVLALKHGKLPPTINYSGPNPKIDFSSTPFYVVDELLDWQPPAGIPRRAGVSSFGIGGTNAHVVLEEAPGVESPQPSRAYQVLPLSGRTNEAVEAASAGLAAHLEAHSEQSLADVAYTLQEGRYQFNNRRFVVCRDRSEAIREFGEKPMQDHPILVPACHDPSIVFMFPGQGAQRVNMGRELYESEPLYREIVDECALALKPELDLDLRDVLYPAPDRESWAEEQIVQTRVTQPALFVTEYALAQLWMEWGIKPDAMIGHSVGEYTAACLAGVFSLEDGLTMIATRARLIQAQPTGTMLAVMAGEDDVRSLISGEVSVATINAPMLCVVSGPHDSIAEVEKVLTDAQLECRRLHTSHAFHSAMMEPVVLPFTEALSKIQLHAPRLPYVSNLTAAWIKEDEATNPSYWAQHLRQAVRFSAGIGTILAKDDNFVLVEVGPGATLTSLTRQHPTKKRTHVVVPSLPYRGDSQSDVPNLLSALGRLWQAGVAIDWRRFHGDGARRRVPLPAYPFERKKYFIEPGRAQHSAIVDARSTEAIAPVDAEESVEQDVALSRRDQILTRLFEIVQSLSGLSEAEIGLNTTFMELGFDSLLLSRACSAMELEFHVPLAVRQVAEDLRTVSRLAEFLESATPEDARAEDEKTTAVADAPAEEISLPLTDAQREVWLASQLDEDVSRTYNEAYLVHVRGDLQVDVLRESLQLIVDRHDALRATFDAEGTTQTIAPQSKIDLVVESLPDAELTEEVYQRLDTLVHETTTGLFDLCNGPLFRFRLIRFGERRWAIVMVIHHVVADGWSWGVMLEELGEVYSALVNGDVAPDRGSLQYAEYVSWTEVPEQTAQSSKAEKYWLDLLADGPEELELPADRPRPPQRTYRSGRVRHTFDNEFLPALKEAARRLDSTVFHLLTASFQAWLYRVTGREDIVLAIPTAGQTASGLRHRRQADRLVGHCVNMLPVRLTGSGEDSFETYLHDTKSRLLDARDHQEVSYGNLVNKLQWPRNPSRVPLASVSLNLGLAHELRLGDLDTETELPPKAHNFFDLTADVLEGKDGLQVDCKFNQGLFDASSVERWLAQWERMMTSAIAAPETAVRDLDILPDEERRNVLVEWNRTGRDFPQDVTLHRLIEQRASQVARRTAVTFDGSALTYGQLERRANRICRALRERGSRRGQLIGVCVERNADMLAAVLAVLKSGAAYVPLDPSFPKDRLRYMADDAEIALLVSTAALATDFGLPQERQLLLDTDAASIQLHDDGPIPVDAERDARPEDPAYVIYTSGSTGKPKGVVVPHRAVVNFLTSMGREPGIGKKDVLVAVTTLSFDIAVLELYLPLLTGARVVIASRDAAADGEALRALLVRHRATMMQATPVTWRLLLDAGWKGRPGFKALVGGEALPRDLADQLLALNVELWNMYGPTETTVWSTCARLTEAGEGITIGGPIANTTTYILDSQRNPCPIGVSGELYIGGDGVTLGYWKRSELTEDRFVPDPFGSDPEARIYATGDRARWLDTGVIEHLGRFDDQVKVRGFRIELGEIEANIARHPNVSEVAVVAREPAPGDQRLVAYLVADNAPDDLAELLRAMLLTVLPDYMVPGHFVRIDKLPRTQNDKLDRKALPDLDLSRLRQADAKVSPRTETERAVAGIWAEVLGFDNVGILDNFFELGGHSLLATKVVTRVRQTLSKELRLRDFFVSPTISALAERIEELGEGDHKVVQGL